jgi:hypothetical protein
MSGSYLWFCRVLSCCTRTMGAVGTRPSLRPLLFEEGDAFRKARAHNAWREQDVTSGLILQQTRWRDKVASPESITTIVSMDSGLALRAPRNDDVERDFSPIRRTQPRTDGSGGFPPLPLSAPGRRPAAGGRVHSVAAA